MPATPQTLRLLGPLTLSVTGILMLWWTWGQWPDTLYDFGHELYIPWKLSEGKTLYADMAYFEGPLSPYWNALIFRLFGVSLIALVGANLLITILLVGLIYAIVLYMADRLTATLTCLVFLCLFAFGQYGFMASFNYLAPYAHPLVHGLVLSVASLWCFQRFLLEGNQRWLGAAGILAGFVFLTKPEPFIAVSAAIGTGVFLRFFSESTAGTSLKREVMIYTGCMIIPPSVAFLLLCTELSPDAAFAGILGSWKYLSHTAVTSLKFYRVGMGTHDITYSITSISLWSFGYAAFFATLILIAKKLRAPGRLQVVASGVTFLVAAIGFYLLLQTNGAHFLRPLPVALSVIGIYLFKGFWRDGRHSAENSRLIVAMMLVVFALALLLKIMLNARIFQYGFVLAMPGTLVCIVALTHGIPRWLMHRGACAAAFLAGALGLIVGVVTHHVQQVDFVYSAKQAQVGHGADTFVADFRGHFVNMTLEIIEKNITPDETIAVLPLGVMINYLARRDNPTPYLFFMPPEVFIFGEEQMLSEFKAHPPDYVILFHVDSDHYGYPYFGRDYAQSIFAWVEKNYQSVLVIGARPLREKRYGVEFLRRRKTGEDGGNHLHS